MLASLPGHFQISSCSCGEKSGEAWDRGISYNTYTYRTGTSFIIVADDKQKPVCQKCSCCPSNQLVYPYRSTEKLKVVAVDLQGDIMVWITDRVSWQQYSNPLYFSYITMQNAGFTVLWQKSTHGQSTLQVGTRSSKLQPYSGNSLGGGRSFVRLWFIKWCTHQAMKA